MKKETKEMLIWGIVIVAVVIYLISSGILIPQKFVISDDAFIPDGTVPLLAYSINGQYVTFSWVQDVNYTYTNGDVFYTIGNSTITYYNYIPTPEGTNIVNKFQIVIAADNTTAVLYKWHTVYIRETQNVTVNQTVYQNVTKYVNQTVNVSVPVYLNVTSEQICNAVAGTYTNLTCTCPNGDKWFDNATSKVCGPITKTVTNDVNVPVQPTFFQKYGLALIILIGAIVIILYMNGGKKRR
jgi:hypothetical protein